MSQDWYQDVLEFNFKFRPDHVFPARPRMARPEDTELCMALVMEEIGELFEGIADKNLASIADGAVDSIVVILGLLTFFGIDPRPIWDEIHRTNMAKEGGDTRRDGKILKPKGWQPPKVKELLIKQGMGGVK